MGIIIGALMISARMIADVLDSSTMAFGIVAGLLLTVSGCALCVSAGRPRGFSREEGTESLRAARAILIRIALAVTPSVGFLAVATALDRGPLQSAACALPAITAQFLPVAGFSSWPAVRRLRGTLRIAVGVLLTAQAIGGV